MRLNPRWKKKLIIRLALVVGGGIAFAGTKAGFGSTDEKEVDKEVYSRMEAEERGYLDSNVSSDDIETVIKNNNNLSSELQNYLSMFNKGLSEAQPYFDKAILKRNIELLKVKKCSKDEMMENLGTDQVYSGFLPITHELCILTEEDGHIDYEKVGQTINNTFGYMTRQLVDEKEEDVTIDISFADGEYGKAFQSAINQRFVNNLENRPDFTNVASFDNVLLLTKSIMTVDDLFQIYTDGNIYDLEEEIKKVNSNLDVCKFIECADKQYKLKTDNDSSNDYDLDYTLFKDYTDLYLASYNLDPEAYENNYSAFKGTLSTVDTDEKTQKKLVKYLKEENKKLR